MFPKIFLANIDTVPSTSSMVLGTLSLKSKKPGLCQGGHSVYNYYYDTPTLWYVELPELNPVLSSVYLHDDGEIRLSPGGGGG